MKWNWNSIRRMFVGSSSPEPEISLDPDTIRAMARGIATTQADEISCDHCFEKVDRFVELTLAGKNASEAMPLVEDHLTRCRDCREEFEALLAAVQAMA